MPRTSHEICYENSKVAILHKGKGDSFARLQKSFFEVTTSDFKGIKHVRKMLSKYRITFLHMEYKQGYRLEVVLGSYESPITIHGKLSDVEAG